MNKLCDNNLHSKQATNLKGECLYCKDINNATKPAQILMDKLNSALSKIKIYEDLLKKALKCIDTNPREAKEFLITADIETLGCHSCGSCGIEECCPQTCGACNGS